MSSKKVSEATAKHREDLINKLAELTSHNEEYINEYIKEFNSESTHRLKKLVEALSGDRRKIEQLFKNTKEILARYDNNVGLDVKDIEAALTNAFAQIDGDIKKGIFDNINEYKKQISGYLSDIGSEFTAYKTYYTHRDKSNNLNVVKGLRNVLQELLGSFSDDLNIELVRVVSGYGDIIKNDLLKNIMGEKNDNTFSKLQFLPLKNIQNDILPKFSGKSDDIQAIFNSLQGRSVTDIEFFDLVQEMFDQGFEKDSIKKVVDKATQFASSVELFRDQFGIVNDVFKSLIDGEDLLDFNKINSNNVDSYAEILNEVKKMSIDGGYDMRDLAGMIAWSDAISDNDMRTKLLSKLDDEKTRTNLVNKAHTNTELQSLLEIGDKSLLHDLLNDTKGVDIGTQLQTYNDAIADHFEKLIKDLTKAFETNKNTILRFTSEYNSSLKGATINAMGLNNLMTDKEGLYALFQQARNDRHGSHGVLEEIFGKMDFKNMEVSQLGSIIKYTDAWENKGGNDRNISLKDIIEKGYIQGNKEISLEDFMEVARTMQTKLTKEEYGSDSAQSILSQLYKMIKKEGPSTPEDKFNKWMDQHKFLKDLFNWLLGIWGKIWNATKEIMNTHDKLRQNTGLLKADTTEWHDQLLSVSPTFAEWGMNIQDVADIQYNLLKATGSYQSSLVTNQENMLKNVGKFSKQFGMDTSTATKVFTDLMLIGGKTQDDATNTLDTYSKWGRVAKIDIASAMKDIAQNSEFVATYTKDGMKNILDASLYAQKLGMNLSGVAKTAEGFLNFESSITSQVKASVMLGKQLDFDRARFHAFNGDFTQMVDSIRSELGKMGKSWEDMTFFQRKALSESVGMSTEELSKFMVIEKNLGKSHGEWIDSIRKSENAVKGFIDTMPADQIKSWNAMMASFASLITSAATILEPFLNGLSWAFDLVSKIFNSELFGVKVGKMIASVLLFGGGLAFLTKSVLSVVSALFKWNLMNKALNTSWIGGMGRSIKGFMGGMGQKGAITLPSKSTPVPESMGQKGAITLPGKSTPVPESMSKKMVSRGAFHKGQKTMTDTASGMSSIGKFNWGSMLGNAAKFALYTVIVLGAMYGIAKIVRILPENAGTKLAGFGAGILVLTTIITALSTLVGSLVMGTMGIGAGVLLAGLGTIVLMIASIGLAVRAIPSDSHARIGGLGTGLSTFVNSINSLKVNNNNVLDYFINKIPQMIELKDTLSGLSNSFNSLNGSVGLTATQNVENIFNTGNKEDSINRVIRKMDELIQVTKDNKVVVKGDTYSALSRNITKVQSNLS